MKAGNMSILDSYTSVVGNVSKIDAFAYMDYLHEHPEAANKRGKILLVTADTPLKASRGEGKTTTTIALVDALRKRGVDATAVLRQPSMGITAAGSKGGASGGGKASLQNPELIDWGLCGEMAAIACAQNLLVSFAEKAVDEGVIDTILVPRVSEVPSRSLRSIAVDYAKSPVAERVVLTPASELMQIVVLSRSMDEITERVGAMIAGTREGKPVTFGSFVDLWRITNMLSEAVKPVKTYTQAGSPLYIHCGPFANVSLGIPSLVSVEMATSEHDVVIVEAGYGADAGAQKWIDIASREFNAPLPVASIVVTRATTWRDDPELQWRYPFHVKRLEALGIPAFPLVNLWSGEEDQASELRTQADLLGLRKPIIGNLFTQGGDGLVDQLDDLAAVLGAEYQANSLVSYRGKSLLERLQLLAQESYGVQASNVLQKDGFVSSLEEAQQLAEDSGIAFDDLALLAIKSPATMTDNDRAPEDERTVTLKKVEVHAGAGLVQVNLTTSLTTPMPKIV